MSSGSAILLNHYLNWPTQLVIATASLSPNCQTSINIKGSLGLGNSMYVKSFTYLLLYILSSITCNQMSLNNDEY